MIHVDHLDTGGLRLADDMTGETYEIPADAAGQRLGRLIRRLATGRYAQGHADGLTEGYARARRDQERAAQQGPELRAKIALN